MELRGSAELGERHVAGRLGARAFRRGAARAILGAGGSFSQLPRTEQWRSSAYQLYLDLGHEESRAMASITVDASDGE